MSYKYKLNKATQQFLKILNRPRKGPEPTLTMAEQRKGYVDLLSDQLFGWKKPNNGVRLEYISIDSRNSDRKIPCTMYHPGNNNNNNNSQLPCFLYFHGGGWTIGSPKAYDAFMMKICEKIQAICISVDYALGPEVKFPGAVHDSYDVFHYIANGHFGNKIDHNKIAISGDSAGGNLTAVISSLAVQDDLHKKIKIQAPLCGAFDSTPTGRAASKSYNAFKEGYFLLGDTMDFFGDSYFHDRNSQEETSNPLASPNLATSFQDLPLTYIAAASHDPLLTESIIYAEKLKAAGVEHTLKIFPGIHIFWMMPKGCGENESEEFINELCQHVTSAFNDSSTSVNSKM